jgi:hypothetical protein
MNVCGKDIRIDGGLIRVARLSADKYEFLDDPEAAVSALRSSGVRIDVFTFMRRLADRTITHPYPSELDNMAAVPISTFEHWFTKQIDGKTRNMVRRAEKKGVTIREVPFDDALVQGISAIYNESPVRQGRPFWHYGKPVDAVRAENGTFLDRSVFFGAFMDGNLIGFAKLVSDEYGGQASLMQIVSMIAQRDAAPTNALIAQAVRSCAERGIAHLVYANYAYGKKQNDSLAAFKDNNGFKRIDLPRYYVPLTLTGRAALTLGLHHGLTHCLPEPLLASLRNVRRLWSDRRQPVVKEPSRAA